MGNCCKRESSTLVWDGEDWGSITSKSRHDQTARRDDGDKIEIEKQRLLGENRASYGDVREVKIKMTKKELEELVAGLNMQGLTVKQVVDRLVNGSDRFEVEHQRSWRPALQSIPEVN